MSYSYKYPRPAVTADLVILAGKEDQRKILLIQRGRDPYKGMWALPGGFVDENEDLADAARRELMEETGLEAGELQQIGAFGTPYRDPRGHTISIGFLAVFDKLKPATPGDDAANARWFSPDELPPLAFDHANIIKEALALTQKTLFPIN